MKRPSAVPTGSRKKKCGSKETTEDDASVGDGGRVLAESFQQGVDDERLANVTDAVDHHQDAHSQCVRSPPVVVGHYKKAGVDY